MCTIYLGMHPEIQERTYKEIIEVFGDSDEVTYEKLRKLQYVEMVLKETMRLGKTPQYMRGTFNKFFHLSGPSVPLVSRVITDDIELDGVFFPKGTQVLMSISTIHRLEKYWGPDANKFNPDNFLPENVAKRNPFNYIPFSAGVRSCIGQKFAMLSLKIMLVNLLRLYKFMSPIEMDELEFRADITLMITNPYPVCISRR